MLADHQQQMANVRKRVRIQAAFIKNYYFSQPKTQYSFLLMQLNINRLLFILLLFAAKTTFGQQAPTFTHHPYTHMFSNAGFAGLGEGICLNGISRQQWVGFNDEDGNRVAPETFLITADSPISLLREALGEPSFRTNWGLKAISWYKWVTPITLILVEAHWVLELLPIF